MLATWGTGTSLDKARLELFNRIHVRRGKGPAGRKRWEEIARPEQIRPERCAHWLYLAGRGAGKTRSAAERIVQRVVSGAARFIALIGRTLSEVKSVMVEGESGLLSVAGDLVESYCPSKGELVFTTGAKARFFSGEKPDSLRGWQSTDVWGDELCAWRKGQETFDMAMFGLRLGEPEAIWTTTPKNVPVLKNLLTDPNCRVTRSSTWANRENLPPVFFEAIVQKYRGSRLGRQELEGEVVEDVQGALWERAWFERPGFRLPCALYSGEFDPPPRLVRVVVGIDPSIVDPERRLNPMKEPDACGIVAAGVDAEGNGYVLADVSAVLAPARWARLAIRLHDMCLGGGIVAEANQGGEMIREVLHGVAANVPVHLVTASMGKRPRAEPLALLYEQGRIRHCGEFRELEEQLVTWDASDPSARSPNNLDALVWAFHGLGLCRATGMRAHDRLAGRD